ncbi:RNA 2',3'-cyclic phosphodiesterase [Bartonella sp. F02]|uniref:RNA 2',3'-cyclic phosphodiesterase n=1 Tax=Bartonella sp. F02 TaxID=2967262 RepID=UPI0022A9C49A|nr:RNA 2',3'-cyclic phosphodiesterase [Bartonella sp. F02]MCZ2327980.1 RNA 2',3'-cyclic phosphodiesterase [Bartonella sp. F02]
MLRLFSAIKIPQQTTELLISLQNGLPKAQWINPRNFHITLSFFGNVEDSMVDELTHALSTIKCPSFSLHLNGFDVFRSENKPHSLVVRIAPCAELNFLHEKIRSIQNQLGLTLDPKQFTPHITLARLLDIKSEDLSSYLSFQGDFSFPSFKIDQFVLFLSEKPSSDAPYIVKGIWSLQI